MSSLNLLFFPPSNIFLPFYIDFLRSSCQFNPLHFPTSLSPPSLYTQIYHTTTIIPSAPYRSHFTKNCNITAKRERERDIHPLNKKKAHIEKKETELKCRRYKLSQLLQREREWSLRQETKSNLIKLGGKVNPKYKKKMYGGGERKRDKRQ